MPVKKDPKPQNVTTYHFRITGDGTYRVWNSTWYGDQFEILSPSEFAALSTTFTRFSIRLREME